MAIEMNRILGAVLSRVQIEVEFDRALGVRCVQATGSVFSSPDSLRMPIPCDLLDCSTCTYREVHLRKSEEEH